MSAPPPAPTPAAPPAKSAKTLLWILVGVGGCLFAVMAALLVLGILSALGYRHRLADVQRRENAQNVALEREELDLYLANDPDRAEKVHKTWDELAKQADAGELKQDEADRLSNEVTKITADGQVTPDEADEAIAMGTKIAGIQP